MLRSRAARVPRLGRLPGPPAHSAWSALGVAGKWAILWRDGHISTMQQAELDWGERYRLGQHGDAHRAVLRGEVVFASPEEQSQRSAELLGEGALLVTLPPPTAEARGGLGERIEELVERELARLGAPSPYLAAWAAMPEDAQARLADQLFRARTLGASGLAIALGSLRAIAAPALTPDDSATLRWLARTTESAALVLLVDDADLGLLGYAAPATLFELLSTSPRRMWEAPTGTAERAPGDVFVARAAPETDRAYVDLTEIDGAATKDDTRVAFKDLGAESLGAEDDAADAAENGTDASEASSAGAPEATAIAAVDASTHVAKEVAAVEVAPTPVDPVRPVAVEPPKDVIAVEVTRNASPAPGHKTRGPRARREEKRATVGVPVSGPSDAWRSWAIALSSARGAQPLATFERLFAESYVPLANAIAEGVDDPRALRAYDEFRRSFERSYTDAFATFGATNRRPRLVMDAYDLASKQARLANARSAHVLVIDSMRFDLGCLVRDALAREASGVATLSSETLLWSSLPTTSMRQLETLARGLDALRAPAREEPSESLRGRAAEVVRRIRVGSREIYKLDLVPAMLEAASGNVLGSLEEIAQATAEAIARHVSTLSPRTMLFILGDHGFGLDRRGEVLVGGASPEEVLVPASSWLVGDLH